MSNLFSFHQNIGGGRGRSPRKFFFEFDFEIMPQDSELEVKERSEFSDFDNNYDDKPVKIPDADLDMASNFLNSLGEDLMEEDILQFL